MAKSKNRGDSMGNNSNNKDNSSTSHSNNGNDISTTVTTITTTTNNNNYNNRKNSNNSKTETLHKFTRSWTDFLQKAAIMSAFLDSLIGWIFNVGQSLKQKDAYDLT